MNRIYLVHPPHFKDDIFKIGGSEQFENDRLKSYGKGTEILAMVVVNGNYREVEKEINLHSFMEKNIFKEIEMK